MKRMTILLVLSAISGIASGLIWTSARDPLNLKLESLSPDETALVRGRLWFSRCDDSEACPTGNGHCISTTCKAVPLAAGGYECTGSTTGCDGEGNYMTCGWAWCFSCDYEGGNPACGTRLYADCVIDVMGGCRCDDNTGGACDHECDTL